MLGVSQPSNPPSSLRHSASFSCLQRTSGETGHRARTSTLPQQPNLQLSTVQQHYGGPTSLQQPTAARHVDTDCLPDCNDYGFVRTRPRLRSTNSTVLREEQERQSQSKFYDSECVYSQSSKIKDREILEASKNRELVKNQNPLRGALILFTASTSSWWKAKQREELSGTLMTPLSCASESSRKWSNGSTMTPPTSERKWLPLTSGVQSERKWSCNSIASPENDRKWTSASVSPTSNSQDRKWRSLGALLRTPVTQTHNTSTFGQNMSMSMIENPNDLRECTTGQKTVRYPQPTSYSARVSRTSRDTYRDSGDYSQRSSKVSRRLYQESNDLSESEEQRRKARNSEDESRERGKCQTIEARATSTRSGRAQSFYLLDDFLKPQPQSKSINLQLPSHYRSDRNSRGSDSKPVSVRNLSNITPPRRHNSSSDSLEVATSPLPPPVPPPPPPEATGGLNGVRDRERIENGRDKDGCPCKMCWANLQQQRSFRDEILPPKINYKNQKTSQKKKEKNI